MALALVTLLLASADPTFNKDVAPILFQNCAACHRPEGGGPFPLLSYADARKRGKMLAAVTKSKQMPPWKADRGDVALANARALSDEQVATIGKWVAAGMPEGKEDRLPALPTFPSEWPLGKPDLIVKMPKAFKVPAEGRDIYRDFAIPLGLTEDRWVRAIDFRPSARSVVHHTLFHLDPTGEASKKEQASGQVGSRAGMDGARSLAARATGGASASLGGWASGARARELPEGLAYKVTKGSDLILATHFHPSGKAEEEVSTVALYFAAKPPTRRFMSVQVPFGFGILAGIDIPAGKKDYTIEDSFILPVDVKAFAASAHAHYIGKTFLMTAKLPTGETKTLLSISDWDFAWQEQYRFRDFEPLPKGTKVTVKITYDNSADNPRNPTIPPRRVRWGRESLDEMGSMSLQVVAANEDEFPKLREAYAAHVRGALLKRGLGGS
jgi:cytochrome c553